jgi:hypothetical protein
MKIRQAYDILVRNLGGKTPLGRPGLRWEDIKEIRCESVDQINLVQDRERWRTFVNTVMNFWFYKRRGISCLSQLTASHEALCPIELWVIRNV